MKLLVQSDAITAEIGTITEQINEYNWINQGRDEVDVERCAYNSLFDYKDIVFSKVFDPARIPVGSIEFVEKFLQKTIDFPNIYPLLIPHQLDAYKHRRTTICSSKEEIHNLFSEWEQDKLFIKSADVLKCDYTDIYTKIQIDALPKSQKYFVSEPVNILSEWRVFVFNGKILDIRNYDGDFWLLPNKKEVEEMVSEYSYVGGPLDKSSVNGGNPPAYTLDVAVIEKNNEHKTAIMEVHNFVSCGLYGFNHPAILQMLKKGWEWEKKRAVLISEIHPSLKIKRKD